MKKLITFLLVFSMIFCFAGCGKTNSDSENADSASNTHNDNLTGGSKLQAADKFTSFKNNEKVPIICWGDSITESMGMQDGYRYPQQLQGDLKGAYKVINAGVGGEKSAAILSRANAVDFVLSNDIVFKEGEIKTKIGTKCFSLTDGTEIQYKGFGQELRTKSVIIGGENYTLEVDNSNGYNDIFYYIIRTDTSAKTLKKGTEVKFDYSDVFDKSYCNVMLMGANDGDIPIDKLIENYKKLTEKSDRYIVIIPFYGTDYSKEFTEAFGKNAINAREYFINNAAKDYNIELTEMDEYCIKKNIIPTKFTYENKKGDCHLNEYGYKIIADLVYKKGVELGYWE